MGKEAKQKQKNRAAMLSLLLIGLLFGAVIGYSQSNGNFTLSQGIYPGPFDYAIWLDSATTYCKNAYGVISSWSGTTNSSLVIQSCIDSRNQLGFRGYGVSIYISGGNYTIDTPIDMSGQDIHLIGDGIRDTVLVASASLNGPLITTGSSYNYWSSIENINLEHGLEPNQCAIRMTGCMSWNLENVRIRGLDGSKLGVGVLMQGATVYGNYYNSFEDVFISWEDTGIIMNETGSSYQSNANWFYGGFIQNINTGVDITNGNGNAFFGTSIEAFSSKGVVLGSDTQENTFEGVTIESTFDNVIGFDLNSTSKNIVMNPKYYFSGSGTTECLDSARNDLHIHWSGGYPTFNMIEIEAGVGGTTAKVSTSWGAFYCNRFEVGETFLFNPISHPNTTGWGAGYTGTMWYCDTHGQFEYWDGNSVESFDHTTVP